MKPLVLYCKSYSMDLRRVRRLAESVLRFNTENLPFYVSVPGADYALFRDHLDEFGVELLADEDIIRASSCIQPKRLAAMPGHLVQQVVKSEFWRLNLSEACLCLDSDSIFIRPFGTADYMAPDGTPYSVITEAHDMMELSLRHGNQRVIDNFQREARQVQDIFDRTGKAYSFGPMPMVWHRSVWESLEKNHLLPHGMSFADAIKQAPLESRWYGEALLKFKAVAVLPTEPFFKVYHHGWQLDHDRRRGVDHEQLGRLYSGVIYQSSWERNMDWPREGGHWASRLARRLRRAAGRF